MEMSDMDVKKMKMKNKIVGHIGFRQKEDGDVLTLANTYSRLRPGLSPKAAIRNFLLENLPVEIERIKKNHSNLATN